MKIFRFSFIIPTLIVISLISCFFIFYLDTYLKKGFISAGEIIFGAKVEVGEFKTKFKGLSVYISDIKIGDKDNEFKNLLDVEKVKFGVKFIPLLSKKINIDNMNIEGIKWGTSRTVSAKLPPKKKKKVKPAEDSFVQKMMKEAKVKANQEFNSFPSVQKFNEIQKQLQDFSPQSIVDMTGIQSVAKVQGYYVDLMGKYDDYNKKVDSIKVEENIKEISELITLLSKTNIKTPADIKNLKTNLENLEAQKENLEQTYNELKTLKNNLIKDANSQKNAFKDISSQIERDVNNIASKLSIPSLDFKNISRMLFGQIWVNRVDNVLYYMNLVKKYIPDTSAEETLNLESKERKKGKDIIYPIKKELPALLISNITISGTSGGEGKTGTPISFAGTVKNITSDQRLAGQITTFKAEGDDTNQIINVSGSFDRLSKIAEDKILFTMDNFSADRLGIPQTDYTPVFKDAKAKFSAEFILKGRDFITNTGVIIDGIYYDTANKNFDDINANIIRYVSILWQGISSISLNAGISITEDEGFNFNFSSDIDKVIGQRFNSVLNAAIGDVKIRIKKEVTQYVETQKKVLQAEADKYKNQIQKELDPKMKDIQKQIDDAKKLIAQKEAELKKQAISSLIPKI